jgi:hypothetical protein
LLQFFCAFPKNQSPWRDSNLDFLIQFVRSRFDLPTQKMQKLIFLIVVWREGLDASAASYVNK